MTYPLGEDPLDGKPCEKCPDYATNCAVGCNREGNGHDSDCATHNEPAYQNGACDCDPITAKDLRDMAHRLYTMSGCRGISTRTIAELAGLVSRAAEKINNLEIALRIKKEEHDCCVEDLAVYRYVEDKCGWSICQYSKQHGWIPVAWRDAVKAIRLSGDGMTKQDDNRFLELTNNLTRS